MVPDPAAVGLGLAARIGDLIPPRHGRVPFGVRPVLEGCQSATKQLQSVKISEPH